MSNPTFVVGVAETGSRKIVCAKTGVKNPSNQYIPFSTLASNPWPVPTMTPALYILVGSYQELSIQSPLISKPPSQTVS